jgi:hypothetical protein
VRSALTTFAPFASGDPTQRTTKAGTGAIAGDDLPHESTEETKSRMEKKFSTQGVVVRPLPRCRASSARSRALLVTLALASTLALGACGLVKVGYRNGDIVGVWWLDRYLDLSGDQKDFVKPRLHQLLAWHRRTQLPDYATFGAELQDKAMGEVTASEVTGFADSMRRRATTTVEHALPDLADLALQLTPANVDALRRKFAKDDTKWRDEFMDGDDDAQKKARYEKSLERIEEWYGRFNGEQRKRIRALSDERPMDNDVLLAERQRRERDLVALLAKVVRDKPPREEVVAMMKAYADAFDHNPDAKQYAALEAWRHKTEAMDAEVHNLATPDQRRRASQKLQDWIDDFRSLSAEAG